MERKQAQNRIDTADGERLKTQTVLLNRTKNVTFLRRVTFLQVAKKALR